MYCLPTSPLFTKTSVIWDGVSANGPNSESCNSSCNSLSSTSQSSTWSFLVCSQLSKKCFSPKACFLSSHLTGLTVFSPDPAGIQSFFPSTPLLVYLSFWAALRAAPKTAHPIAWPLLFVTFCPLNTMFMHLTTMSGLHQFSLGYAVPRGIGKVLQSLSFSRIGEQSGTDISRTVLQLLGSLLAANNSSTCSMPWPELRGRVMVSQTKFSQPQHPARDTKNGMSHL